MPNNLKTGWVAIATSGPTADGRTIEKKWLTDMAENYNPAVFSAKLWPDHLRFFGSQGKVLALKTEPATDLLLKDEIQLFAILAPSDDLVAANKRGLYTHTSIEVDKNFAGKGFTYLGGLAITDSPASLGTSELQFSANKSTEFFNGIPLDLSSAEPEDKNIFEKIIDKFKPNEQATTMEKEQFAQLLAAIKDQATSIAAITEKFGVVAEKISALTPAKLEPQSDPAAIPPEKFTALESEHKALCEKFSALSTKVEEAIKTGAGSTTTTESTGPADSECL